MYITAQVDLHGSPAFLSFQGICFSNEKAFVTETVVVLSRSCGLAYLKGINTPPTGTVLKMLIVPLKENNFMVRGQLSKIITPVWNAEATKAEVNFVFENEG